MSKNENVFFKKKILIYGLGKSGLSTYQCLKKRSKLYLFDDKKFPIKNIGIKKN
jgi:UDP-N-acetylmuramoylalanine--D-glutamate ligase